MKDNFRSVNIRAITSGFMVEVNFSEKEGEYPYREEEYYAEDFEKALELAKEKSQ